MAMSTTHVVTDCWRVLGDVKESHRHDGSRGSRYLPEPGRPLPREMAVAERHSVRGLEALPVLVGIEERDDAEGVDEAEGDAGCEHGAAFDPPCSS